MLPHLAMQQSLADGLPQHLQGVLSHNRGMCIYRTFHNLTNGSNVAIHAFLCELEKTIRDEGKLPDTVFYQIDGGSENTAKCWFALCELLIARRLCKKIVLTRLMVGHTHEDIDAKFGNLWTFIRNKFVYTPQQYELFIKRALSTKTHACEVVDLHAIPDYKAHFDKYVDRDFKPFCKEEKISLQWTFEAVTPNEQFPLGVRVLHRTYCADEVVEILEDASKPCGIYAKVLDVFNFPMKDLEKGIVADGMSILTSLPSTKPDPFQFVPESHEVLADVMFKVDAKYGRSHPAVMDDWKKWRDEIAPKSDKVEEYLEDKTLHIPLGNLLFSDLPMDMTPVVSVENSAFENLERMRSTDCVRWSRWGFARSDQNVARIERAVVDGVEINRDALPKARSIWRPWKKRTKLARDEDGNFTFILAQDFSDPQIADPPFTKEGQVIKVAGGGHRVYWRNKRTTTSYPDTDQGDKKSLKFNVDEGLLKYGAIIVEPTQVNNTIAQPTRAITDDGEVSADTDDIDEDDSDEDIVTDSDDDEAGWLTCKSKFKVPRQV